MTSKVFRPIPVESLTPEWRSAFWSRITPERETGCWTWQGPIAENGYARVHIPGQRGALWLVHRVAFTLLRGPIPPGLEIDHLCRNRACINAWTHLEPVTSRINTLRGHTITAANAAKTDCPSCHAPFAHSPNGKRFCRSCKVAGQRASHDVVRQAAARLGWTWTEYVELCGYGRTAATWVTQGGVQAALSAHVIRLPALATTPPADALVDA